MVILKCTFGPVTSGYADAKEQSEDFGIDCWSQSDIIISGVTKYCAVKKSPIVQTIFYSSNYS